MERIAVTGATGYVGRLLTRRLTESGIKVHAIARNEGLLTQLRDDFPEIEIFPCSLSEPYLLNRALKNCTGIYHLAAMKDVGLAEQHVQQMIDSNITGTLNLLRATIDFPQIRFIVGASSDKAVKVAGVYGASKFIAERLFDEYHRSGSPSCIYRVVRYGNILHSTSSVLVKWRRQLENGDTLKITDPEATRFFITRDEAVNALFDCRHKCSDATPYYPEMKSLKMQELLELMIQKYASGRQVPVVRTGLRAGENKHEFMDKNFSSEFSKQWSREEMLRLI